MTNIYLLIYPKLKAFKIGKADDVFKRASSIKKWWGEPDYANSFSLEIRDELVFKLEKGLHLFVDQFSMDYADGDGKTEFFDLEVIDDVIGYISIFIRSNKISSSLVKGVDIPSFKVDAKKPIYSDRMFVIHRNQTKNTIESLENITTKMKAVFRVCNILIKYRNRIRFEFAPHEYGETLTIYGRYTLANVLYDSLRGFHYLEGSGGYCYAMKLSIDKYAGIGVITFNLDDHSQNIFCKALKNSFDQLKKAAERSNPRKSASPPI